MNLRPYIQIARPDHWFKNGFMVLGIVIVVCYEPEALSWSALPVILMAVSATCLVASSNYVLNEILDAETDRKHPTKCKRPIPSGQVNLAWAWFEWVALAAAGFALAATLGKAFLLCAVALWGMALVYNVPPVRAKEQPYLDVITESVNNPIRLLLGWFALVDSTLPPVSLMLSYWGLGAFLMATKRYAELRSIGDRARAASYRRSFRHYTEERLLVSMFFYATICALFGGVFVVRCKLELIFAAPFIAGAMAYYLRLGMAPDSPTQNPELLYKERGFFGYLLFCGTLFMGLMFADIPYLGELFHVQVPKVEALWSVGGSALTSRQP